MKRSHQSPFRYYLSGSLTARKIYPQTKIETITLITKIVYIVPRATVDSSKKLSDINYFFQS